MVSFRMSEEEYERLWNACAETGARSVSDLARTAVGLMIGPAPEPTERHLEGRVRDLENLVHELSLRFGQSGARTQRAGGGSASPPEHGGRPEDGEPAEESIGGGKGRES